MKRKLALLFTVLAVCAAVLIPQLAADVHFFFSGETDSFTLNPLEGWAVVLGGGMPLRFYLLLTASLALFLLWFLTKESVNCVTKLQRLTPDIATPEPAGQGQFGTSRWSGKEEQRKIFTVWKIHKRSGDLKQLLRAGKEDRKEIRHAEIPID